MSTVRKPAIDTCHACGKLFPRIGMRLCVGCSLAEQNRFELVRVFLDEHGGGSVSEIAQTTGVSAADVRRFLEGGRLVAIQGGVGAGGPCTCSGSGERCVSCRSELGHNLRDLHDTMAREQGDRPGADRGRGSDDGPTHLRRRRTGG